MFRRVALPLLPVEVGGFTRTADYGVVPIPKTGIGSTQGSLTENGLMILHHSCAQTPSGAFRTSIAFVFVGTLPKNLPFRPDCLRKTTLTLPDGRCETATIYHRHNFVDGETCPPDIETVVRTATEILTEPPPTKPHVLKRSNERQPLPEISTSALAEMMQTKRVVFYTGSGLSAPVIPTLKQWQNTLGFQTKLPGDVTLKAVLGKMHSLGEDGYFEAVDRMQQFIFTAEPTAGHRAIKALADRARRHVLTENLDSLHEKSGVSALRVFPNGVYDKVSRKPVSYDIGKVDVVICVGLSADYSRFLQDARRTNPNIKFVSINPSTEFGGPMDFHLKGDAQTLLPTLVDALAREHD
ncbi:MAG: hypothetical protein O3A01_04155 [bacterium]|nr:hypothetical protein [bacterium]